MLLHGLKGFNFVLLEVSLGFRCIYPQEDGREALIVDIFINCEQDVVEDFLFGDHSIIEVIQDMEEEEMGHLVGNHLLQGLLDGLDHKFSVFGVQDVEQDAGDGETLLGSEQRRKVLLHGLSKPFDFQEVLLAQEVV